MNEAVVAALVAAVMAMGKALDWAIKRRGAGADVTAPTGTEMERQIRETYEQSLLAARDIEVIRESVQSVAQAVATVSASQERIAELQARSLTVLEKLDRRTEIEHQIRMRPRAS